MSDQTTSAPAADPTAEADKTSKDAKPATTKSQAKAKAKTAPKKTVPKETTVQQGEAPTTPRPEPIEEASATLSVEEALKITGAVVRPQVEPNARAPKPVPAGVDDVHAMEVTGNRVSIVTVDGQKFSGKIA